MRKERDEDSRKRSNLRAPSQSLFLGPKNSKDGV